jgi:hypothetical protein
VPLGHPIHLIASLLLEATEEQLKESYPRLTRQMIRLAPLYAAAYPLRGRPRQSPVRHNTLRIPSEAAPSRSPWSAILFQSRQEN